MNPGSGLVRTTPSLSSHVPDIGDGILHVLKLGGRSGVGPALVSSCYPSRSHFYLRTVRWPGGASFSLQRQLQLPFFPLVGGRKLKLGAHPNYKARLR
jgi:hypothetical protein